MILFFKVVNLFLFSLIFSNQIDNFNISNKMADKVHVLFNNEDLSIIDKGEYSYISENKISTIEDGYPELPVYTFSYGVKPDKEYNVSYNVLESDIINNITIHPYQPIEMKDATNNDKKIVFNHSFYESNANYPSNNISSNRAIIRGNHILTVELIPYIFNPSSEELLVFNQVEIVIEESLDIEDASVLEKHSKTFDNIYNNLILDTFDDREINYQDPSVLYICGGGTLNYAYMDSLIDWRRKQGYHVDAVSLSNIGSSTSSIKNYIQDAYDNWSNPPEFVCLVGDDGGSFSIPSYDVGEGGGWWGAMAESDLPYVLLDGSDIFADATIGRLSIRSQTELNTVVNKIIGYEKLYAGSDWIESVALVGDPYDSGISTVISNEYIAMIMENYGVEDINEQYSGNNSFDDFMVNQLNSGISFLNYRGFYGFSGFNSQDVNQLTNGFKLPFLTTLTCDTGSFATETSCIAEQLFKAGTLSNPKGAVAVVATAQPFTHTAFNNIVAMGMYSGVFLYGAKTAGEALVYGELALSQSYPQNPNNNVYYFSAWNNLMGDPATILWTDTPQIMIADHLQIITSSDDLIDIFVIDADGIPVEGANVNLSQNSEVYENTFTNEDGHAYVSLYDFSAGDVDVTVTCHDCKFSQTTFEITEQEFLEVGNISINNGPETLTPGWEGSLLADIINDTDNDISYCIQVGMDDDLIANTQYCASSLANTESEAYLGNLTLPLDIYPDSEPMLYFIISDINSDLQSYQVIDLEIYSALTGMSDIEILDPGESSTYQLKLNNYGELNLDDLTGYISAANGLSFSPSVVEWSSLGINLFAFSDYIEISASDYIVSGSVINIPVLISSSGYEQNVNLSVTVGNVSVSDPLGPDAYGYYIYDTGDLGYDLVPTYDWMEIKDIGNMLPINDNGNNQDESTTIPLPFEFTFYGIDYNEITVCSNGWVAFGDTDLESFRNYPIPGTGGPSPMVAVFWDDLEDGDVYYYHDLDNNRFIIEWDDYETYYGNAVGPYSEEIFQIILYNTDSEVITGDDEMLLQYKDFNNTSQGYYPVGNYDGAVVHGQFASVGIEDHTGLDGLEYTFNNQYPTAAATLSDNSALFITTRTNFNYLLGDLNQDLTVNVLDVILAVNIILDLDDDVTSYEQFVGDINEDNQINILDVVLLVEMILG